MSEIRFEPISPATEVTARRIITNGLTEHFGHYEGRFNPDIDELTVYYSRPGGVFLVGLVEGEVVCTGGLLRERQETGRIVRMSVAREHRGKGYARRMIRQLEECAGAMGYTRIVLETNNDWDDALGLYVGTGYSVVRRDNECTHFVKELK